MSSYGMIAPEAYANASTPFYEPLGSNIGPTGPTGPKGDPGTGAPATWSQYPATQTVVMNGNNITSTTSYSLISGGNIGIYANGGIAEVIGSEDVNIKKGEPTLLAEQNLADETDLNIQSDTGISFQAAPTEKLKAFSVLDMNNNAIINCPSIGGAQGLASVLANSNSAGDYNINMNVRSITNALNINGAYFISNSLSTESISSSVGEAILINNDLEVQNNDIIGAKTINALTSVDTPVLTNSAGATISTTKNLSLGGSDLTNVSDISMSGLLSTITNTTGTINVAAGGISLNSLGSVAINSANALGFSSSVEKVEFKDNTISSYNSTDLTVEDVGTISSRGGANTIDMNDVANDITITTQQLTVNGVFKVSENIVMPPQMTIPSPFAIAGLQSSGSEIQNIIAYDTTTGNISYEPIPPQANNLLPFSSATTIINTQGANFVNSQFVNFVNRISSAVSGGVNFYLTGPGSPVYTPKVDDTVGVLFQQLPGLITFQQNPNVGGPAICTLGTGTGGNFTSIDLNTVYYFKCLTAGVWSFLFSNNSTIDFVKTWSQYPASQNVDLSVDGGATKNDLVNAGNIDTVNLKVNEISPILPLISSDIGVVGNLVFDPAVGSGSISNITQLSGNGPITIASNIDMDGNAFNNASVIQGEDVSATTITTTGINTQTIGSSAGAGVPIEIGTPLDFLGTSTITNCPTITDIQSDITTIQSDITTIEGDITTLQTEKLDKSKALYVNSYYVNDNVNDIQTVVDEVGIQQGNVIYVGAGSYGGSTLTLSQSNNIGIIGPAVGAPSVICELAGGRGMTLTSGSQRVRVANLQIEGLLTLAATGNNYFQSVQCLSGITISAGASGNYFLYDCEISGPITVPNTFSGVIGFVRCNFAGATFTLNNVSPLQVQITQGLNLPVSRDNNATYGGTNADVNLLITENAGNVIAPKISAPSGFVDVFTNGVKRVFFNDSGINMNASTDGVVMNGGDITGANNITCSTLAGRFSGPFSTERCSTLGSELTYNSGTGALSLLSQTGSTLSTITVSGGGGGSFGFYEYNANIADIVPPPGNGNIRWNNETQPLATELYVSHLTRINQDIDVFLESIVQGDTLIIQDQDNSALFQKFIVNGVPTTVSNTYWTFPVMLDTSSTSFTAGQNIALIPLHTAVSGVQSVSAGDGVRITGTASEPIVNADVIDIVAGTNITIDEANGIYTINASGGGGGGQVDSVVAGQGVSVDSTDPAAPVVSLNISSDNANLSISDNLLNGQKVFSFQSAPQFTSVNTGSITNSGDLTLNPLGTSRKVIVANADVEITGVNKTFIGNLTGNASTATSATSATTAATATNALACSGNSATATLASSATNVAGGSANALVYNSGVSTTTFLASDPGALVKFNDSTGAPETVLPISLTVGAANISNEAGALSGGQAGDIPYQTGSTTDFLPIGLSNRILTSTGTAPQWTTPSSITVGNATNSDIASNIIGKTAGAILYNSASSTTAGLAIGSAGQVLTSNGSIPAYVNQSTLSVGAATNISGGAAGSLLYQSAANTTAALAAGSNGQILTLSSGVPAWTTISIPPAQLVYSPTATIATIQPTQNSGQTFITTTSPIDIPVGSGFISFRLNMAAGSSPAGVVQFSFLATTATNAAFTTGITSINQGHMTASPSVNGGTIVIPYVVRTANPTGYIRIIILPLSTSFGAGNTITASDLRVMVSSATAA